MDEPCSLVEGIHRNASSGAGSLYSVWEACFHKCSRLLQRPDILMLIRKRPSWRIVVRSIENFIENSWSYQHTFSLSILISSDSREVPSTVALSRGREVFGENFVHNLVAAWVADQACKLFGVPEPVLELLCCRTSIANTQESKATQ